MKQLKQGKPPIPKKSQSLNEIRQEIDHCVKEIVKTINQNPRKAAKIFECWLGASPSAAKKNRVA